MRLVLSVAAVLATAATASAQEDRSPLAFDLAPGVTVTPYGYLKLDGVRDYDFSIGRTTSPFRDIGLPDGPEERQSDEAFLNETRLGFNVTTGEFLFKLEGDFYGADDSLRLRLGYVDWRYARLGQDWTNFMLVGALPETVDFQGSGATPFARVPLARLTFPVGQGWTVSAAVEEDVKDTGDPAFTLSAQYEMERGTLFASGVVRDTTVDGESLDGWGLNLSTRMQAWEGGTVRATLTTGDGIADYLSVGFSGSDFTTGSDLGRVNAGMISVSQQVTDRFRVAATGTWIGFPDATGIDTENLQSLHLSGFYTVARNTVLMAEYFYGNRDQDDGESFSTDRIQVAVKYSF